MPRIRIHKFALVNLSLIVLCAATSLNPAAHADVEFLTSPGTESINLPFSEAVRVNGMLYLSGQIGNKPGSLEVVPGGIEGQTHQVMRNIQGILERNGALLSDVVKCTVMMADIDEWAQFNQVYVTYFPGPKPARSAFAAAGLAVGARVEVECWAALSDDME